MHNDLFIQTKMRFVVLFLLLANCGFSTADRCGVTDFLEQLIQTVNRIQPTGPQCGSGEEPRVGKAGPIGPPGPRGPPGMVDIKAVKRLVQEMINENLLSQIGYGELCYMGMKSRLIADSAITASSIAGVAHESYRGRLDNQEKSGDVGAWLSGSNTVGQWLQVDFGSVKKLAGVITQGRSGYSQWVRSYKVSCAGSNGQFAAVQENGRDKVFQGNEDRNTKVYNRFSQVLSCQFIRIYPQSWYEHMAMRVEFVPGACYHLIPPFNTKSS